VPPMYITLTPVPTNPDDDKKKDAEPARPNANSPPSKQNR